MVDANALQYAVKAPARAAAERFARLHGALELKATLLALLLPASSQRAIRAFEIETAAIRPAETLQAHARDLPGSARLPWFELLLTRMALQPLGLRQELLQATRRVMSARGVARPIDRLHWATMRRALGEPLTGTARSAGASDVSEWLETDLLAIGQYSAFLSRMVPVEAVDPTDSINPAVPPRNAPGPAWYLAVMETWQVAAETPPLVESPSGETALRALATLQTLSMMQRPVLARGWVMAALTHAPRSYWTDSAADALRLTCRLLDTPLPPELERHYIAIEPAP